MKNEGLQSHWNTAYDRTETEKLGWYEESCAPSLDLIKQCNLEKNATIINVGAGATLLIDELIELDYHNLIATDISENALNKIKTRLGVNTDKVKFIVDDLTNSETLQDIEPVDLWHDRAVLHFFNTKDEQNAYFKLLHKLVKPKGYAIIATFNLDGALKCSGLPVYRYDEKMIAKKIGEDFELIQNFDYTFHNPSGDTRAYIYTLFRRK